MMYLNSSQIYRDRKSDGGCQGLGERKMGSYCLRGMVSDLQGEKNSVDGWW